MSLWGKILGSTAGLVTGGPIGGLIGFVLGAVIDEGVDAVVPKANATRQIAFTIGVIALAAKMAKADGRVTQNEVEAFKAVFKVPASEMKNVARVFDRARQDTAGYQSYAKQIASLMQGNRVVLQDLMDALFFIALADGHIHPKEIVFLKQVAEIFGFSPGEWHDMKNRYMGPDTDNPYSILGVSPDIDHASLKSRYRDLVRDNHPDRLLAQGVPPDFIAVATRRAAEINAAYDAILESRGVRR